MRFKTIYFRSILTLFIFVICIAAQLRFVTEIASKSPLSCVNRSPIRSGFRVCAKAIGHSVNIASVVTLKVYHNAPYRPLSRCGHFVRGTQRQFLENICSEDDLRSRIFGTFVVKFLACMPLLGFSNLPNMV